MVRKQDTIPGLSSHTEKILVQMFQMSQREMLLLLLSDLPDNTQVWQILYYLHNSVRRHLEKIGLRTQKKKQNYLPDFKGFRAGPSSSRYLIYLFTLEIWIRILMIFIGKIFLPTPIQSTTNKMNQKYLYLFLNIDFCTTYLPFDSISELVALLFMTFEILLKLFTKFMKCDWKFLILFTAKLSLESIDTCSSNSGNYIKSENFNNLPQYCNVIFFLV